MKIGFSTYKNKISSRLIRYFSNSDISHAFPIVGNLYGNDLCLSASAKGVQLYYVNHYFIKDCRVRIYELSDKINPQLWIPQFISKHNLDDYGFLDLLYFLGKRLRNNPVNLGSNCQEITGKFLIRSGYDINADPNSITPKELETIVKNIFGAKLVYEQDF